MYVIWRDKENKIHRILCINKKVAKDIYNQIEDFKVKEISEDKYGIACGLYKLSDVAKFAICV